MKLYFESAQQLLDSAFASARKRVRSFSGRKFGEKFRQIRVEESTMLSESCNFLIEKIEGTVRSFPDFSKTSPFYREIASTATDLNALKKALGHLSESARVVKRVKFDGLKNLHSVKRGQKWDSMSVERKKLYGRISGILRKLSPSLEILKKAVKQLKELPSVDEDAFNVVLAGFPNSGKSTMLKRLTGSEPKIAHYAFTTKSLMQGFIVEEFVKVQVFDTPGLLDRMPSERNAVEKKAASALRYLAELIVFIADCSKNSEFTLSQQLSLLSKLRSEFPRVEFFVVLSKCDSQNKALKQELFEAVEKQGFMVFEQGEGLSVMPLKEKILERASALFKKKFLA